MSKVKKVYETPEEKKFVTKVISNMFKPHEEKFHRKQLDFGMNH